MLIALEESLNGSLSEPDHAGSFTSLLLTRLELKHIPWGQPVVKHPYHPLRRSFILHRLRRCQVYYFITPLTKPFCVVQLTEFPVSLKSLISFCSRTASEALKRAAPACGRITPCAVYSHVVRFEMGEACVKWSCLMWESEHLNGLGPCYPSRCRSSVQDSGSFVGVLSWDDPPGGTRTSCGEGWWVRSVKWSNRAFLFQDIPPEVPSPDDSPRAKPCVPRGLRPGPPLGHQPLPADVRGQYLSGPCSGMSQNGLPTPRLVLPSG